MGTGFLLEMVKMFRNQIVVVVAQPCEYNKTTELHFNEQIMPPWPLLHFPPQHPGLYSLSFSKHLYPQFNYHDPQRAGNRFLFKAAQVGFIDSKCPSYSDPNPSSLYQDTLLIKPIRLNDSRCTPGHEVSDSQV